MSSRLASGLTAIVDLLLGYDSAVICSALLLLWNVIVFTLLRGSLRSAQARSAWSLDRGVKRRADGWLISLFGPGSTLCWGNAKVER